MKGRSTDWPQDRTDKLKVLWAEGLSARDIAAQLGGITRNAVLGRVHRLGISKTRPARVAREKQKRIREKRLETRPLRSPLLFQPAGGGPMPMVLRNRSAAQLRQARIIIKNNGATKTSAAYRKHLPKQPEMTRGELRAMLAQAVANTAEMT